MSDFPLLRFFMGHTTPALFSFVLITANASVLAHTGHGNAEFQGQSAPSATQISVDADTALRIGLKVEPVTQQSLVFGIKATGQIETLPDQQVEVTTPVGGTVTQLLVKPGEMVQAGQAVAIMSSPELAQIRTEALDRAADAIAAIQQAQADLQLAQQNYDQQQRIAKAEINQARTVLNFAQERYDRDRELLTQGAIPRRQFLESETQLAEAKALLTKADSQLQVFETQNQIKHAKSALQIAQSKMQLSDRTYLTRLQQLGATPNPNGTITLKAPITGVVADREVTRGESSQDAGLKVMTLLNGHRVFVAANIYEKDLNRIKVGQTIRIQVNGLPNRVFQGRIRVIGTVVDRETRIVPVRAELDNAGNSLKPGMFAELEILTNKTASVLAIPTAAVLETNDKRQIVFVQNGNAYEPVEVALGEIVGKFVEVKDGLFEGDLVVTQRANQLYAQSLRGSNNPKPTAIETPVLTKSSLLSMPELWVKEVSSSFVWVVPVVAIATTSYWMGRRRVRRKSPTLPYESE